MVEKINVGNVSISVVFDAAPPPREPDQFFPDVPLEAWEPYKKEHLEENGEFRTEFCSWALRSEGQTVLVDTGLGPGPHERLGGARGQLMSRPQGNGREPGGCVGGGNDPPSRGPRGLEPDRPQVEPAGDVR